MQLTYFSIVRFDCCINQSVSRPKSLSFPDLMHHPLAIDSALFVHPSSGSSPRLRTGIQGGRLSFSLTYSRLSIWQAEKNAQQSRMFYSSLREHEVWGQTLPTTFMFSIAQRSYLLADLYRIAHYTRKMSLGA